MPTARVIKLTEFIAFTMEAIPVSTNAAYRNASPMDLGGRGRRKTQSYKTWLNHAQLEIMASRVNWPMKKISGPFAICIAWPKNNRRDLDNYWKPFLDMLKKMGVIDDDVHCQFQLAIKNPNPKIKHAMVVIRPAHEGLMNLFDSFTR